MTNETFNVLAQYEDIFNRVKARQYHPYPGRVALQNMVKAIKEVRPNYRTNLGCSSCVRSLVLECAGMYWTEKSRREYETRNAAKTDEKPNETEKTGETPTPKKKSRKTKKDA